MVSVLAAQRVRAIKTEGGRKNLENQYAIEMLNITKKFPGIIANDNITLQLKKGEIHALLGENGAGKSTLMSVLFGLYQPEEGIIKKDGKVVSIKDPNDATALGIGMVHQHFKLVDVFTVLDNIILGAETTKCGFLQKKEARKKVEEISKRYGLNVDLDAKVEDITVGMQQRVEILKMLYRDNEILIFDEPTAVLTPQEIEELMATMKEFAREGKSILFISHKLNEIMEVSDRVSVLRKGKYIGTVNTSETTKQELSNMMVGRPVQLEVTKDEAKPAGEVLKVDHLCVHSHVQKRNAVNDVSFNVIRAVLYKKKNQLLSSVFIIFVLMMASSLCMYSAEHEAQPEAFRNVFSGIWWSVSTLLTVGYGDIYPVTVLGRIMAICIAFLGVGVVAIPTGIISAGFVEQYTDMQSSSDTLGNINLQTVVLDIDSSWLNKSPSEIKSLSDFVTVMVRRDGSNFVPTNSYRASVSDILIGFTDNTPQ